MFVDETARLGLQVRIFRSTRILRVEERDIGDCATSGEALLLRERQVEAEVEGVRVGEEVLKVEGCVVTSQMIEVRFTNT